MKRSYEGRIRYTDVGAGGLVGLVWILEAAADAVLTHKEERGEGPAALRARGARWRLKALSATFERRPAAGDVLLAETWLEQAAHGDSINDVEIVRVDPGSAAVREPVARMRMRWTAVPVGDPGGVVDVYGGQPPPPDDAERVVAEDLPKTLGELGGVLEERRTVRLSDLGPDRVCSPARQIAMMLDLIGVDKPLPVTRMEVVWGTEAGRGQTVAVRAEWGANACRVAIDDLSGGTCCQAVMLMAEGGILKEALA